MHGTPGQGTPGASTIFARPSGKRDWLLVSGLLGALLMAFGSVGPWLEVGRAFSGGVRQGHVWLILVLAVVGAALLVAWRQRGTAGLAAFVSGVVGVGVALYDRSHWGVFVPIHARPGVNYFIEGPVHLGWGLYLALFASLGLAMCGLVWLAAFGRRKSPLARAAHVALMVAAATVLVYGFHGPSATSLVAAALVYAGFGFLLGLVLSALLGWSEFVAWCRAPRRPHA